MPSLHSNKWFQALPLGGLLLLLALGGCSPIQPWVKPYERNNLADPIMQFSMDPVESGYMHHVYQAREAARGAEGGGGGGCGCN
ncbi:MAG: hypothetical protein CMK83_21500 [Pseudomonadales bacterium]|jgi:hypothetical protein|uniref:DUF4266 domain-containing protein n=1 Tax=unclassified Ketobacter TaxID=2639109 RepID=UPI000C66F11D|nr:MULTISPECIES: DUF4266 domain-containing protein [unclassified Ketobacter]MAA60787.1 hypothetical protein [Pseudomonadales bacterium]MEC8809804.1 DUF4266 domain-containing protein [Pseudomonadota bacterium]HAG96065.1 hypothetical protein [Gammaproteobacteria bacterium]MAQ22620.1 hypothetical protein [Pseudomonadales bacterium]MAQ26789.1 hypothetical protein [Pseudomonadales bacterium]|tara:strand:+ start:1380 stop:1631 length:252 start_codon:yes stop_codon:yes gene_type:complete